MPKLPRYLGTILSFLLLFASIFTLCFLMPLVSDDFTFQDSMRTYADAFNVVMHKYVSWDGRAIIFLVNHTLLYLPHSLASALIALMFCILTLLMHVHIYGRAWLEKLQAVSILWIAALLWAVIPAFGAVIFWRAGTHYLYAAILFLLFLLPHRFAFDIPADDHQQLPQPKRWQLLLFFLFGMYVGLHDYSVPLVFAALSLGIWLYNKYVLHRRVPFYALFCSGALGLVVSCILVLSAPGNMARASANPVFIEFSKFSIWEKIARYYTKFDYVQSWFLIPYFLLAWGLYVLLRRHGKQILCAIPCWAYFFLAVAQLTIISFAFSPAFPTRVFTSTTVFLIIGSSIVVNSAQVQASKSARRVLALMQGGVFVFCLFSVPYEAYTMMQVHATAQQRIHLLEAAQQSVCIPEYNLAEDRFLPIGRGERNEIQDVIDDPTYWINKDLALRYGLDEVRRCPIPPRHFTAENENTPGLKAKLDYETMHFEEPAESLGTGRTLEIFYPSKIHIFMNPNPALSFLHNHILSHPYLRDVLVPLFYKNLTVALQPGTDPVVRGDAPWEYITPEKMHFYVRFPGSTRLTRFTDSGTQSAQRIVQ